MALANGGSADILMLEAPPELAAAPHAEIIDALPYIDDDYGNPIVKEEVDRLVEEEMRRSSKKPSDFLKDLPPLPKSNFQNVKILRINDAQIEFQRISEVHLIRSCDKWFCFFLLENLEVISKHGPEVWKLYNQQLEAFPSRMKAQVLELNGEIDSVNRERKYHQQNTAYELTALSTQWRELCLKNVEIQATCALIETHIKELKSEAAER